MSTLFPAIKAEVLVIGREDNTTVVVSDVHDEDVDLLTFYGLAILNILNHAHRSGVDAQKILDTVLRMGGLKA